MGFLSALKKVGKIALKVAPFAAAPFTGGLSVLAQGAITGGINAAGAVMGAKGTPAFNPNARDPRTVIPGTATKGTQPGGGTQSENPFMSMVLPSVISGGSSLLAGWLGSRAAGKAANVQADAATDAANRTDALYAPWRKAGEESLISLRDMTQNWQAPPTPESVMASPMVQARLKAGREAIEGSAAAKGTSFSGSTLQGIDTNAQRIASEEYGNEFNRFQAERGARFNALLPLAGYGQAAVNQTNAGVNQYLTDASSAKAAGAVGSANSWRDSLQDMATNTVDLATLSQIDRMKRAS